jgi:hypothetical protein
MGNFSRDTFSLTNAVHRLVTGAPVANPRHYVGVRVQQGVPVLDADLNELDEVRRREHEITLRELIGDGIPGQGDGFAIGPIEQPNDFIILPGLAVVGGWQVINLEPRRYSQQPRFFDADNNFLGTDLTPPGAERIDLVYLDAWEEEVRGTGAGADPRLVNVNVGIETAVRIERRWTVRVAENALTLADAGAPPAGHKFFPLARLYRAAVPAINPAMIEDRRRLGLTLAQALRAPMYVRRGSQVVDPPRFIQMLRGLREALAGWQQMGIFPVTLNTPEEEAIYANALNRVFYLATASEVASIAGSLDNAAGLAVLEELVNAQAALIEVLRELSTGDTEDVELIDTLESYLEGGNPSGIAGVRPAIERDDLLGAVRGQEALTTWLGLGTGQIPQGTVTSMLTALPPGTITAGVPLVVTYTITSNLGVPADSAEIFDLLPDTTDAQWEMEATATQVSLMPNASAPVQVTITPSAELSPGDFTDVRLVAQARRRPSIASDQPATRLTIGAAAPAPSFFAYQGPVPLQGGELVLTPGEIQNVTFEAFFRVVNTAAPQDQRFRTEHHLVWPGTLPANVNPAQWLPATPQTNPGFDVTGENLDIPFSLRAPSLNTVTEDVTFTLHIVITLIGQGGVPVADGKSNTVDLPVRVNIA